MIDADTQGLIDERLAKIVVVKEKRDALDVELAELLGIAIAPGAFTDTGYKDDVRLFPTRKNKEEKVSKKHPWRKEKEGTGDGKLNAIKADILAGMKPGEIAEKNGCSAGYVYTTKSNMKRDGQLEGLKKKPRTPLDTATTD